MREWHTIHAVPDHPLLAAHHLLRWEEQQARSEKRAALRGLSVSRSRYRLHRSSGGLVVQWGNA